MEVFSGWEENGKKSLKWRVISCHKAVKSLCEVRIVITLSFWKVTEMLDTEQNQFTACFSRKAYCGPGDPSAGV